MPLNKNTETNVTTLPDDTDVSIQEGVNDSNQHFIVSQIYSKLNDHITFH